jgi:hypothetical protein
MQGPLRGVRRGGGADSADPSLPVGRSDFVTTGPSGEQLAVERWRASQDMGSTAAPALPPISPAREVVGT